MKAYFDKIDPKLMEESKTQDVPFLLHPDQDWKNKTFWFSSKRPSKTWDLILLSFRVKKFTVEKWGLNYLELYNG